MSSSSIADEVGTRRTFAIISHPDAGKTTITEKLLLFGDRGFTLIMFPEGMLNGIIMTGLMVFYPDWIRTFDARKYIDEQ